MATKKPATAKKVAKATTPADENKPAKPNAKVASAAAKAAKSASKAKDAPTKAAPAKPRVGASIQARPPKAETTAASVLDHLKQAMEEAKIEQVPKAEPLPEPVAPLPWEDTPTFPDIKDDFKPDLRYRPDNRISLGVQEAQTSVNGKLIFRPNAPRPASERKDVKFFFRK